MIRPEHTLALGQCLPVQSDRSTPDLLPTRMHTRDCYAMRTCSGDRDPGTRTRSSSVCSLQRDRPSELSCRLEGAGEIVTRGKRVGMVETEHPLAVGDCLLDTARSLERTHPLTRRRRQGCCLRSGYSGGQARTLARSLRMFAHTARPLEQVLPPTGRRRRGCYVRPRVSGWPGPSNRSQSASVCSYSGIARPRFPGRFEGARQCRCASPSVSGCSEPSTPLAVIECLLIQWDRLSEISCGLEGAGEVVAQGQRVGVVRPEHVLAGLKCARA